MHSCATRTIGSPRRRTSLRLLRCWCVHKRSGSMHTSSVPTVEKMLLTSPGGMATPRSSVVLWALLLGGGACSMLLGGCLLPLRTMPKAVQIQPQTRAEQRQHRFQDTLRILAGTMPVPAHKETVAREAPALDTAVTWCLQSGPSRASSALVAIVESHS